MKFIVSRASGAEPPCEQAVKEPYVRTDYRTASKPEDVPFYQDSGVHLWYEDGRNHRVELGQIARDFDDEAWFVEIPDLDHLAEFGKFYGEITLSICRYNRAFYELQIVDEILY